MSDRDLIEKGYQGLTGSTRYVNDLQGCIARPEPIREVASSEPQPWDAEEWRKREAERIARQRTGIDTSYADDPRRHYPD